jgi:hypothetical protein
MFCSRHEWHNITGSGQIGLVSMHVHCDLLNHQKQCTTFQEEAKGIRMRHLEEVSTFVALLVRDMLIPTQAGSEDYSFYASSET